VVTGLELLRAQAWMQARLFLDLFGRGEASPDAPEVASLDGVLELALRPRSSLVLVGLRGAGKTTVGRAVARHLGRPFVDLDEEVERISGRSPAAWIEAHGVEAFRLQEARALAGLEGRRGIVVATGGGVLERREHAARLRALGFVAWLDVAPEVAARRVAADPTPRPPLLAEPDPLEEARRQKARRDPQYLAVAHEGYPADGALDALVRTLTIDWARFERDLRRNVE
jgi:shikimate kinase